MRRWTLLALMMTLLLGGCGAQDETVFEDWRREAFAAALRFDAQLTVTTQRGETAYAAACRHAAGETELTLTAPETVAGVRLRCAGDGRALEFDGAILLLPPAAGSGMDPCAALPGLLAALETGRLRSLAREAGGLAVELERTPESTVRLWLDGGLRPTAAEWTENGVTVVFCNITNWTTGE